MKIIDQSWEWVDLPTNVLKRLEVIGRVCYKSEDKICDGSDEKFVRMILSNKHESILEHINATVKFITNRGVTHELVRHRLCAFTQESTRYVNYGKKEMEFIKPVWMDDSVVFGQRIPSVSDNAFFLNCGSAENQYNRLLEEGWPPEKAREVLPNALKTEIVVTANLREWRHIFKMRTSPQAHPQMRSLMISCCDGFRNMIPVIFDDIPKPEGAENA